MVLAGQNRFTIWLSFILLAMYMLTLFFLRILTVIYSHFSARAIAYCYIQIMILDFDVILISLPGMPNLANNLQVRLFQLDVNIYHGRRDYLTSELKGRMPFSCILPP